jgi:hypothetical protein
MKPENYQSVIDTVDGEIILQTEDGTYLELRVGEYKKEITHLTRRQVLQLIGALQIWMKQEWN